jgi:hypothetical protein
MHSSSGDSGLGQGLQASHRHVRCLINICPRKTNVLLPFHSFYPLRHLRRRHGRPPTAIRRLGTSKASQISQSRSAPRATAFSYGAGWPLMPVGIGSDFRAWGTDGCDIPNARRGRNTVLGALATMPDAVAEMAAGRVLGVGEGNFIAAPPETRLKCRATTAGPAAWAPAPSQQSSPRRSGLLKAWKTEVGEMHSKTEPVWRPDGVGRSSPCLRAKTCNAGRLPPGRLADRTRRRGLEVKEVVEVS